VAGAKGGDGGSAQRSTDFIALLEKLDARFGPRGRRKAKTGCPGTLDTRPIHTSKASTATPAARKWIMVEWLPRYAPEFNDIEPSRRDLKRHHLAAHQTFQDTVELDAAIHEAVEDLNQERRINHPCDKPRIAAYSSYGLSTTNARRGDLVCLPCNAATDGAISRMDAVCGQQYS
jgi:transposase